MAAAIEFDEAPPPTPDAAVEAAVADEAETQVPEAQESEAALAAAVAPEEAPEEAPAPETEQPARVTFSDEQQAKIDEIIAERLGSRDEQIRNESLARLEAEQRLRDLESRLAPKRPDLPAVPDAPDPFDPEYEAKVRARDEALAARVRAEAVEAARREQAEQARQQEVMTAAQSYRERAEAAGVAGEALQAAGRAVAASGAVPQELMTTILADEQGPQMTLALHRDPTHLTRLAALSPVQAALYMERVVRPSLATPAAPAPVSSGPPPAPPPTEPVRGGSAAPSKGSRYRFE